MIQNILHSNIFIAYLCIINLITFAVYGIDKWKAKHNKWRVREATLLGLAVFGGSVGAFAGMYTFRHKTKHWYFVVGVPLIFVIQTVLLVYCGWIR